MKMRKTHFSWPGILLLIGVFTFAGLIVTQGKPAYAASTASPAFVRIIHASPFVGTADVFLDGSPLLTSFGFGSVTGYASIPEGSHKVQIALAGKGIGASALTQTLATQPGQVYTVAAIGTSPQNLGLIIFSDNNVAAGGTARVRVYQLSPDAGSVNVTNDNQSVWDGGYQQASEYFTYAAGTSTFSLNSSQAGSSLTATPTLKSNTITSIFMVGLFNGSPKARIVQAQVPAVPGLPQTGSDPYAFVNEGQPSTPWLPIVLAILLIGGVVLARRKFLAR